MDKPTRLLKLLPLFLLFIGSTPLLHAIAASQTGKASYQSKNKTSEVRALALSQVNHLKFEIHRSDGEESHWLQYGSFRYSADLPDQLMLSVDEEVFYLVPSHYNIKKISGMNFLSLRLPVENGSQVFEKMSKARRSVAIIPQYFDTTRSPVIVHQDQVQQVRVVHNYHGFKVFIDKMNDLIHSEQLPRAQDEKWHITVRPNDKGWRAIDNEVAVQLDPYQPKIWFANMRKAATLQDAPNTKLYTILADVHQPYQDRRFESGMMYRSALGFEIGDGLEGRRHIIRYTAVGHYDYTPDSLQITIDGEELMIKANHTARSFVNVAYQGYILYFMDSIELEFIVDAALFNRLLETQTSLIVQPVLLVNGASSGTLLANNRSHLIMQNDRRTPSTTAQTINTRQPNAILRFNSSGRIVLEKKDLAGFKTEVSRLIHDDTLRPRPRHWPGYLLDPFYPD